MEERIQRSSGDRVGDSEKSGMVSRVPTGMSRSSFLSQLQSYKTMKMNVLGSQNRKAANMTPSNFKKNCRRLQYGSCNFRSRNTTIDSKGISLEILDF